VMLATYQGHISVGARTYVGPQSILYGHGGLEIGPDVLIAAHCVVIPANHRFDLAGASVNAQGEEARGVRIDAGAWLGAGVIVLDGVTVGRGAVVAAGSVVTRSIPNFAIAMGVPARVVRYRPGFTPADVGAANG
jgi:acetyltransferase-like isoleucine patch superfamily enzyme